jgi:hypothetical protein
MGFGGRRVRQSEAEKAGVDRKTFQGINGRIRKNRKINLNTGEVRRLIEVLWKKLIPLK